MASKEKWVRELAAYYSEDYIMLLKKYGKPILAITGTADISTDYRKLFDLKDISSAEIFALSNVNHILLYIKAYCSAIDCKMIGCGAFLRKSFAENLRMISCHNL